MTNPVPAARNQLSSQPTNHPISYGPWLILIVLLLAVSLFGPLNFLLNQLNSSNYTDGLPLNRATMLDWILYVSILLLTPIALVSFWYKKHHPGAADRVSIHIIIGRHLRKRCH
jgi:hypothetical protein